MARIDYKPLYCLINGESYRADEPAIAVSDRGFQYGDGLFETIRVNKGRVFYIKPHLQRLTTNSVQMNLPFYDEDLWLKEIRMVLEINNLMDELVRLKIIVTRGSKAGLDIERAEKPTRIVLARKYSPPELQYKEGIKLRTFDYPVPFTGKAKTLNYLFYLMARQDAIYYSCDEALLIDVHQNVCESSTGSLRIKIDNAWIHPLSQYKLPGVTEGYWRHNAIGRPPHHELEVSKFRIPDIQAAVIMNSMKGFVPVTHIDGKELPESSKHIADELRRLLFEIKPSNCFDLKQL